MTTSTLPNRLLRPGALTLALLLLSSCASSLVYSPALELAPSPLKQNNGQVMAGGELLAETRPNYAGLYAPGYGGSVSYGFSNVVSLQVKVWQALYRFDGETRGGGSGSAIVMLNDSTASTRLAVIPTFAMLFSGGSDDGHGASLLIAAWLPSWGVLHPYVALGPAAGWVNLSHLDGYGLIGNIGAAFTITHSFTLTFELAGVLGFDVTDDLTSVAATPKVSLGWLF